MNRSAYVCVPFWVFGKESTTKIRAHLLPLIQRHPGRRVVELHAAERAFPLLGRDQQQQRELAQDIFGQLLEDWPNHFLALYKPLMSEVWIDNANANRSRIVPVSLNLRLRMVDEIGRAHV